MRKLGEKRYCRKNPYLQRLVLIGQEKKALDKLQSGARQQETDGKLVEISYEELKNGKAHEKIKELPDEVPCLYFHRQGCDWTKNMQ